MHLHFYITSSLDVHRKIENVRLADMQFTTQCSHSSQNYRTLHFSTVKYSTVKYSTALYFTVISHTYYSLYHFKFIN